MVIETARAEDLPEVGELLASSSLPGAGVSDHFAAFLVAREENGSIVGCIGAEIYGDVGLLRSLAVAPAARGAEIGARLVETLLDRARERGLRTLFLLTTTAERYFPRFGFQAVARDEADERLEASEELRGACPDSAVLMRLSL